MFRFCKKDQNQNNFNRHNYVNQQITINFYFNSNKVYRAGGIE
jgi:hypothetical protein